MEHAGYKKKEGLEGAARTKKLRRGVGPYIKERSEETAGRPCKKK